MRYVFLIFITSCTNTDLASMSAFGRPGEIECFSGGVSIFKGKSTGRIQTVESSDGWEFEEDGTGKFIRVSGDCVIKN